MSSRYHGPMKYMGNFKAVAIDYEYYLTLSDVPQSVCLTERQMYVLTVQNTYTYWATRWYNIEDTSEQQLQLIASEIEDLLMCGCGVPEPSITDRFTTQNYISTTNTTYNEVYNTWNDAGQTITSIAPNLDIDTGDPVDINRLFCLAFEMMITAIAQTAKSQAQQNTAGQKDIVKATGAALGGAAAAGGIAISAGGSAAAVVAFIGGPWTLLGLALAGIAVGISQLFITTDTSVYDDQEAIEQLRCTMYLNTDDTPMTQSAFAGSLTPAYFTPDSNAAKLAVIVQKFIGDVNFYVQFLSLANQLYDAINVAALPDCPCDDSWSHTFNFLVTDGGFVTVFGQGVWTSGTGWVSTYYQSPGGGNGYRGVELTRAEDFPLTTFNTVSYTFVFVPGLIQATGDVTSYFAVTGSALIEVREPTIPTSPQTWTGSADTIQMVLALLCGMKLGAGDPGGSVTLTELTITGFGPNPFL